jgi:uncharacterized OsmC-like protein
MNGTQKIRDISERNVRLLTLKPDRGHLTGVTRARIQDGLRCEVSEGAWKLATDMPAKSGGEDSAPTPGMLGRGALASCLAIGITMWAARLGVPLNSVEVEVQADFDARGELGVGDVPAGYQEVRRVVWIDSPASTRELVELIDTAERHSPYLDVFGRAQSLRRVLHLHNTTEE